MTKRDRTPASNAPANDELKSLPIPEVEKKLGSSPEGLTQGEARKRLTEYGPNEIQEKKTNPLLNFLRYFWGPIPWMIESAVILSGVVRHWADLGIILLLLFSNAVVGFWEERQAGDAIAALKAKLAIKARVLRDGQWVTSSAREAGTGRRDKPAPGRHRSGGRTSPVRRSGGDRPVGADRRVLAGHAQTWRRRYFLARSSARVRSMHSCMERDGTPTSAGRRSWYKGHTRSATFSARC